jgi:prophage tail gpP-like protein
MPGKLVLRVNGVDYGGWKSARVSRGIDSIAGSFELSVSERWAGFGYPWPIHEEDQCSVLVDGQIVIFGYVSSRSISYDATSHEVSIAGRDKAGELVDCSADMGTQWEFSSLSVLDFCKKVCSPFVTEVRADEGVEVPSAPKKIKVDPGDSAFEAIAKACRMAGVLPVSDGAGGIVLTKPASSSSKTALVEGKNILRASADYDGSNRFRRYRVLSQHQAGDDFFGEQAASISGSAEDAGVRRDWRTLLLRADGNATEAQAIRRAQWEATIRSAHSHSVSITVQGWSQSDGSLWRPNQLIDVKSPMLEIDSAMLAAEVVFEIGERGTTTELHLVRPDAYSPEPVVSGAGTSPWSELAGGV